MKHIQRISNLLQVGAREVAFQEHHRPDGSVLHTPKSAGTADVISLRSMNLSPQVSQSRALRSAERDPSVKLVPLSSALLTHSRVAKAGASVIVHAPAPTAVPNTIGEVILVERPTRFTLIEAAPFEQVADGSEVETTDPAIGRATISFSGPSYAVSYALSRRDISEYGYDTLAEQAMESIAFGLARACDHALLTAIVATTPNAFTIGEAAAAGFEWSELRSFVGTSGAGAAVGADGVLRAAGIPAALTPTIAPSIAGSFSRAAVAVLDDLRVAVDRRGLTGGLALTVWADIQPLLPNARAFWSVN